MNDDGDADLLFNFCDENGQTVTNANLAVTGSDDKQHRGLLVNLWVGTWGENRKEFVLRQSTKAFKLRNEQ